MAMDSQLFLMKRVVAPPKHSHKRELILSGRSPSEKNLQTYIAYLRPYNTLCVDCRWILVSLVPHTGENKGPHLSAAL